METYSGKREYSGENIHELYLDMYAHGMTYSDIGNIFNLTRAGIHISLKQYIEKNPQRLPYFEKAKSGEIFREKLRGYVEEGFDFDYIVSKFDTKKTKVINTLNQMYPRTERKPIEPLSQKRRLDNFAKMVFGDGYKSGDNLANYIYENLPLLDGSQKETIEDYYLNCENNSARHVRWKAVHKFADLLNYNIQDLIEEGVINGK